MLSNVTEGNWQLIASLARGDLYALYTKLRQFTRCSKAELTLAWSYTLLTNQLQPRLKPEGRNHYPRQSSISRFIEYSRRDRFSVGHDMPQHNQFYVLHGYP